MLATVLSTSTAAVCRRTAWPHWRASGHASTQPVLHGSRSRPVAAGLDHPPAVVCGWGVAGSLRCCSVSPPRRCTWSR